MKYKTYETERLFFKPTQIENIDLGFAFLPEFQKQGYAYESSNKLIVIAFNELNIKCYYN